MKTFDIPKSGKRGMVVAFKSRFGQCEREFVPVRKPRTDAQLAAQDGFGTASLGWNSLTDDQWDAWRAYGKETQSHPRGGQSGPLTGQNLYTSINRNQALLGLPPFEYPPERPAFDANPVAAFTITQGPDGTALKLHLTAVPAGHILVFASRPHNAGRRYCDKFIYIGPLPPPDGDECDFTAPYVEQFGYPPPGSRVFLTFYQQVNGWRNLPHRIEAVFRPAPPPAPRSRRRPSPAPAP